MKDEPETPQEREMDQLAHDLAMRSIQSHPETIDRLMQGMLGGGQSAWDDSDD